MTKGRLHWKQSHLPIRPPYLSKRAPKSCSPYTGPHNIHLQTTGAYPGSNPAVTYLERRNAPLIPTVRQLGTHFFHSPVQHATHSRPLTHDQQYRQQRRSDPSPPSVPLKRSYTCSGKPPLEPTRPHRSMPLVLCLLPPVPPTISTAS